MRKIFGLKKGKNSRIIMMTSSYFYLLFISWYLGSYCTVNAITVILQPFRSQTAQQPVQQPEQNLVQQPVQQLVQQPVQQPVQ
jgi:hypothetical protein